MNSPLNTITKPLILVVSAVLLSLTFAAQAQSWDLYDTWPFDAKEAARRQTETAQAMKQPVEMKIPLDGKEGPTLNLRLIPAGRFTMGSPTTESGHEGDETLHPQSIPDPFYMMETQLTVEQYRALMHADPPDMPKDADPKLPVALTYRDAVDKVLPALAKLAPAGSKVILPDRARLEYAARAGVATMNPGGDTPETSAAYAWSRENSENKVHPVAQKQPNAWGLYDVIGNRWHWFWRGAEGYGDASEKDHAVYGGAYNAEAGGNGTRLANINISSRPEGVRYAFILTSSLLPKGHPDTAAKDAAKEGAQK